MIAICPNNNEIWVYETLGELDSAKWKRRDVIHAVFLPFACSLYYVAHYENHWPGLVSKQQDPFLQRGCNRLGLVLREFPVD